MFGISFFEIAVVMVVVLLVFGPDKLPEFARKMGGIVGQLRKSSDGLRREFYKAVYDPLNDLKRDLPNPVRDLRTSLLSPDLEDAAEAQRPGSKGLGSDPPPKTSPATGLQSSVFNQFGLPINAAPDSPTTSLPPITPTDKATDDTKK